MLRELEEETGLKPEHVTMHVQTAGGGLVEGEQVGHGEERCGVLRGSRVHVQRTRHLRQLCRSVS